MFTLHHQGEALGTSNLGQAEPEARSVSGVFDNMGGPIALAGWIMAQGGTEDGDVVYLALGEDFKITKGETPIQYDEAVLIAVPDESEAYLEITFHHADEYQQFFMSYALAVG